jgi:hypothetical protein
MSRALHAGALICLIVLPTAASAEDPAADSTVPSSGLFIGLGGSLNALHLDQDIGGFATSEVFNGPTLIATGEAGGPPASFDASEAAFAPLAQVGYFAHFDESRWLWGAKFSYQYLDADLAIDRALVPQVGSFTTTGPAPVTTPFTGTVVIGSSETTVEHEMLLLAFLGRSFTDSYVYVGGGPALFGTKSLIKNAIGFADINGRPTDVTGAPVDFSSSEWVWGGAAQVGVNYFITPTWSLDLNYTFARSSQFDADYAAGFSNPRNGTTGFAHLDTSQTVTPQSVRISINKVF